MLGLGPHEIIALLLLVLLLFGARRLPELGKSLGQGMREFKRAINTVGGDDEEKDKPNSA